MNEQRTGEGHSEPIESIDFRARFDKEDLSLPKDVHNILKEAKNKFFRGDNIVASFEAVDGRHGMATIVSRKYEISVVTRREVEPQAGLSQPDQSPFEIVDETREEEYLLHLDPSSQSKRFALYRIQDDDSLVGDSVFGPPSEKNYFKSLSLEYEQGDHVIKLMQKDGTEMAFAHYKPKKASVQVEEPAGES